MYKPSSYARLTASGIAHLGPCTIYGVSFKATAAADTLAIVDSRDGLSGQTVLIAYAWQANTNVLSLAPGIHLENGIYLTLAAGVGEATILYRDERDVDYSQIVAVVPLE